MLIYSFDCHSTTILIIDERDYQDIEGVVFHLNSSQHILNVSIPLINDADLELNEVLHVSLRLLSDDFSCVTIKPATADIHIFSDEGKFNRTVIFVAQS